MTSGRDTVTLVDDELDVLAECLPLAARDIIELGCGAARLARSLLERYPDSRVSGLEVDERQHAKNLAWPQPGLTFVAGGAQAIPFADASFDLALMLKSLHHVPVPWLAQALGEVARVLRPGGTYVGTVSQGEPFHSSYFHHTPWGLLSVLAATPGLRPVRLWAAGGDTLASLARMGRYPRVVRWLLSLVDGLHRGLPLLAPRKARWPRRARELDRLYRAASVAFLVVKEGPHNSLSQESGRA